MHELSIAIRILELIKHTANANNLKKVSKVIVQAGELAAIVPESLQFCFDEIKKNTVAAEAELLVEIVPLKANCSPCAKEFRIEDLQFTCPVCGNKDIQITAGEEISLYQLDGVKDGN